MRRKLLFTIIFIVLLFSCIAPLKKNTPLTNQPTSNPDTISLPTKWPTATESSENQENEMEEEMKLNLTQVPVGINPTIDGVISPGEWDDAIHKYFTDGSELLILQLHGYLYLGIRAIQPEMISGNVFIDHGDQISILHTSAALGTAVYQISDENWHQIQGFAWCCRNIGNSESALAERTDFLQEEGWLAANGLMGIPNELEYQIKITEQVFHFAVVYIKASYPYEKVPWPIHLEDDCILPSSGGLPFEMQFSPDQWSILDFSG